MTATMDCVTSEHDIEVLRDRLGLTIQFEPESHWEDDDSENSLYVRVMNPEGTRYLIKGALRSSHLLRVLRNLPDHAGDAMALATIKAALPHDIDVIC